MQLQLKIRAILELTQNFKLIEKVGNSLIQQELDSSASASHHPLAPAIWSHTVRVGVGTMAEPRGLAGATGLLTVQKIVNLPSSLHQI